MKPHSKITVQGARYPEKLEQMTGTLNVDMLRV